MRPVLAAQLWRCAASLDQHPSASLAAQQSLRAVTAVTNYSQLLMSTVRQSRAREAVAPCGAAVLRQRARYFSIAAGSPAGPAVRAAALPAGTIPALPALPAAPGRAAAEPRAGGAAHARRGPEGAAGLAPVRAPRWGCGSAGAAAG